MRHLLLAFAAAVLLAVPSGAAPGDAFPDLQFDGLLAPGDYPHLGLSEGRGAFALSQVPGELLVLEFFNRYCLTCQRQAADLEAFFRATAEGDLAGRVRLLAVGVGNRDRELRAFRQEFGATYPLTADPTFERFLALGDVGVTPFTVFLTRRGGQWTLADHHLGAQGEVGLLARSRVLLQGATAAHGGLPGDERDFHPPLGLTGEEQAAKAKEFLERVAGQAVAVDVMSAASKIQVYRALDAGGRPTGLYARIASRDPVCDVCHAVHFVFAFDREGRVRGYEPLHVTKFGNELWSPADNERLWTRLADRPLRTLEFDADVDAVTSATMSSALIFDEIRRAAALLPALAKPEPPARPER